MSKKARPPSSSSRLRGKVVAFNISPKGHIEGALIETAAGAKQLNVSKHDAETLARSMRVGSMIDLQADLEADEGDHVVYRAEDSEAETDGTIIRLNYALHGEVNGCHLDDGTFVHVTPEGARKYELRVGERIKGSGPRRQGADAIVLQARSVKRCGKQHQERPHA
jgi:hypothetical protein